MGAGPVGSVCALAYARNGARVALLEGNPKAAGRLAGEWLHPPAVRMLRDLGITLDVYPHRSSGKGFLVFPEDRSSPIELPYPGNSRGLAYEHAALVREIHSAVENESNLDFYRAAHVRAVEDGRLSFAINGEEQTLKWDRVVGADGRGSIVRRSLGMASKRVTCSRMIGLIVEGVSLPNDGYGHVILGGPGPILLFNLGAQRIRIVVDVPLDHWSPRDRVSTLAESYAGFLPISIQSGFVRTLGSGNYQAAANELQPRVTYGNSRRVLIGDAAGHYHPLTAVGITLGFADALTLAESEDFHRYTIKRMNAIRAPEILALGLYEVFADYRPEATALRNSIFRRWRTSRALRNRTMNLLACEDSSVKRLGLTFFATIAGTILEALRRPRDLLACRRASAIARALAVRVKHFLQGYRSVRSTKTTFSERQEHLWSMLQAALLTSMQVGNQDPRAATTLKEVNAQETLGRAAKRLISLQRNDGRWEGEMVWCPMLTAQYILLYHIVNREVEPDRRRLVLRQFERTRLKTGEWGLHAHSQPYLFVTTLVYVAARLLGVERDDPLIARAGQFIRSEGVLGIPSWGKFWLALLNLYDWKGLNPVLPELWFLPRRTPIHPSNWYCHTRLIYMAMAAVSSHRFAVPVTPVIAELRDELFPLGFAGTKFPFFSGRLRRGDLFAESTIRLRVAYTIARLYNLMHSKRLRDRCVNALLEGIRWELQNSSHTSISPVSGFLNILALWMHDSRDADCTTALAHLEDWIWEDEHRGTRVTGARSASWDSGFVLQALGQVRGHIDVQDTLDRGVEFLSSQQIRHSFAGYQQSFRSDPKGGWCFAGVWHGWPVTDCTAEAVLGLLAVDSEFSDLVAVRDAIAFMLRGQNLDGGFGSYEARRSRMDLEWMNPAEMFGESMTERSYVECTGSCLAALAACQHHFPKILGESESNAMLRGDAWLRRNQQIDGSWRGVWGVQFIYGTLFGIRGLVAAGAHPGDPALRLACRWLLARQREDGGWGEHYQGCKSGQYVPHHESQVIHTAWAIIALLEAGESNWGAISHGVQFLIDTQKPDGTWPRQDMAGVFFRTALLDYVLYRQYFPLHALGLYERRRLLRRSHVELPNS